MLFSACMNKALKVTKIGNSAGLFLPKEVRAHRDFEIGGTLSAVETEFEAQMTVAREVMALAVGALSQDELADWFHSLQVE